MNLVTIVAETAAEALAEVQRRLGPQAVVVNVRRMPAPGISRIWKKPQIELQATVPGPPPVRDQARKQEWAEVTRNVNKLKQHFSKSTGALPRERERERETTDAAPPRPRPRPTPSARRSQEPERKAEVVSDDPLDLGKMLENLGLLPLHAQWLADQVKAARPDQGPPNLRDEFEAVESLLLEYWNRLTAEAPMAGQTTRILVGAPGVGKTTCLCKWLTQEVLLQNRTARVWRLDSDRANAAELLSIHGEILGVPVDRVWTKETVGDAPNIQFVDLPGVQTDDASGMNSLQKQLQDFQPAHVFLVLNAAYDLKHLLAHVRAFSGLPISGLILTHLDEENRWSKFWNLSLSSQLPVLYLCGGQNIPGHFSVASPQSLFDISADESG